MGRQGLGYIAVTQTSAVADHPLVTIRYDNGGLAIENAQPHLAVGGSRKRFGVMGIVVSMLMIAAGAIMRFAVSAQGRGWNVHTTGVVLMIVGAIGAVLSIFYWASWGGFGQGRRSVVAGSQQTSVVREREVQQPS